MKKSQFSVPLHRRNVRFLAMLGLLFSLVGCGGGGGGGGGASNTSSGSASGPVFIASPDEGSFVAGGSTLELMVLNTAFETTSGALYTFVLYNDAAGLDPISFVEGYEENAAGLVTWNTGQKAYDNVPYYWRWSAIWLDEGGIAQSKDSAIMTVRATRDGSLQAASPRDGGSMDKRNAAAPVLAVRNYYTGDAEQNITYDFDLYADPEGLYLIQGIRGVGQQTSDVVTAWAVQVGSPIGTVIQRTPWAEGDTVTEGTTPQGAEMVEGGTYYWRSRVVVDGVPENWTSMYSFVVRDLCAAFASPYAEHITEWTKARHCDALGHNDTNQALGAPNAYGTPEGNNLGGFVSIDIGGILGVEMGRTVYDGPGDDIQIWEYIALEPIELFAAMSEIGPWVSLGSRWCDPHCDWDMGAAGVRYARFFRIKDGWTDNACHSTSGSDIDAVVVLNAVTNSGAQCGN